MAHPFWERKTWKDPEIQGATGLEIYSATQDVTEENIFWLGFWTIFFGLDPTITQWLDRREESLALWDRWLARGDRVVGIGSPDAHGLKRFGLSLGPYTTMFKLVRNHLLVREVSERELYGALEQGRLFVAHDIVADAAGFQFLAVHRKSVVGVMGDRVKFKKKLRLYAYLPSPGEMILLKDGKRISAAEGQHDWFEVAGPGVYRMEATRGGKPWIYSNPIYVIE